MEDNTILTINEKIKEVKKLNTQIFPLQKELDKLIKQRQKPLMYLRTAVQRENIDKKEFEQIKQMTE